MNTRGIWGLVKLTGSSWMAQRSFFFLLAFGWMIPPLIYLFVWSTAASSGTVGGFTRGDFVTYYLVLIIVNQFTFTSSNWTVGDSIRDGHMNAILLRPIPPITDALANELAGKAVFLLFDIPVVIGLALILHPELDPTAARVVAFLPALMMAMLLRFFWGYALALLAFWATRADALLAVQDSLIFILAGQVAPVALLPGIIHTLALYLPFRYMVGFPIEVLTENLTNGELVAGFGVQIGWFVLALIVARAVWRAGIRRYEAVGG